MNDANISTKYKPYLGYKHSRTEWLQDIPIDWSVEQLGFLVSIITGCTPPKSSSTNYSMNGIPWVKPDNLGSLKPIIESKEYLSETGEKLSRLIPKGSILVCCIGSIGKVGLAGRKLTTNQQINSLVFNKSRVWDPKFALYSIVASEGEHQRLSNSVVVSIINKNTQSMIKFPLPSLHEQCSIATFLDHHTARIDSLVEKYKRLIELLEEKRAALITQAVTKGLDPNFKMKESGIEWLGEIPAHWEVKPLFKHAKEQNKKNIDGIENNVLSLSYGKIIRRDIESNFGLLPATFNTYQIVHSGNIILRLTDLQNDKKSLRVGLVTGDGIITSAYLCLITDEDLMAYYFYYLLHSYDLNKVFYAMGGGVRQTMKFSDLKRLPITIPPIYEQKEIEKYILSKIKHLNSLLEKITQLIERLNEFRSSLISNAVSGKIDVRGFITPNDAREQGLL